MSAIPKYISTQTVADYLNSPKDPWDGQRARRWLKRSGALVKKGRKYFTTPELLKNAFPEAWETVLEAMAERDDE